LKLYDPAKDTTIKKLADKKAEEKNTISRSERKRLQRETLRKLTIDTLKSTATMELNTFSAGRLRKFFRQSFRTIKELQIKHLILDVRNNGGGEIDKCILLAKYIRNSPFKAVDTCTAASKSFGTYGSGINLRFFTWMAMQLIAARKADGQIHCGSLERKIAQPKTTNHFNGQLYVLTSGPSFSATTLFLNYVKNEPNVTTIGEETSGGSYGNSGVLIPSLTMPNTKIRIRMPLFKIVNSENLNQKGRGFSPTYYVPPTLESIKKGIDLKMQKALSLIAATSSN
jgi:C-terminal processing protease CtpA/Prc